MKYILLFCSLFLINSVNAQETSYQGLLWEITGNGIEKPSYLYGTMHVSRKIAFNLDDIFFESLKKADMVAVESMPDNWLDNLFDDNRVGYNGSITGRQFNGYSYGGRDFYKTAFQMNFPDKMDIVRSMFGQYQLINGLLYRSEGQVDFEEDTYLDMFIYQTGKRFDKKTYSLEGHEESRDLVEKAIKAPRKDEIDEWLKKKIEKNSGRYNELIQDAYRDRNIGLIDSINRAINSEIYMENMLYKRNENMVDSMETLMKTGSLFAGVGAAHLPGEQGMIDLLRKRGYTLKPLFSEQTDKGKNLKSTFEANFIEKKYRPQTTKDGFITSQINKKTFQAGTLEIPTLKELRSNISLEKEDSKQISIREVVGDVKKLHQEKENDIKVMSFNVRVFDLYMWTKEKTTRNKIFDFLKEENPDILCLQEFYHADVQHPKYEFKTLDTLVQFLSAKNYHVYYTTTARENDHWGLVTFSKFPIKQKK